ncbi:hypothetical protein [Nannocystis punicea]|uniref:Uncharacterized protein n=1 Tax=Nannocystis punicea TaxID=2995304 RepID=A0ABY7GW89_9BACT|nr:hypothetical protein [Nannocystis poenicansa]WAS91245.1 hypothetical protein O0S08_34080 [Nannocystis poenicansa]
MPDVRMIPSPTLARAELDVRLRALGYARTPEEPRSHLRFRLQTWQHPAGASVILGEAHVTGERYVLVHGEAPDEVAQALDVLPRATLLREAEAAPGPREALPWLRRLCLLEYDAPSPELREHLTRALTAPDLMLRSSATAAAMGLTREHAVWALELVAKAETEPALRKMYARTAKAERARLDEASEPTAAKPAKKSSARKATSETRGAQPAKKSSARKATAKTGSTKPAKKSSAREATAKTGSTKPAKQSRKQATTPTAKPAKQSRNPATAATAKTRAAKPAKQSRPRKQS